MDEMRINSSFLKAWVSTVLSNVLKSKGLDIDISISKFEMTRDDNTKKLKLNASFEGTATDDQLMKLIK